MRRVLLLFAGAFAVLVLVVTSVGYVLPVAHIASSARRIRLPPDRVFAIIASVEQYPAWRSQVRTVEVLSTTPLRWREHSGDDAIIFVLAESRAASRLVTRIDDPELPFGGTWTFDLADNGSATTVTITEHGQVFNPLFRFASRFVLGHTASIDSYLDDLSAHAAALADHH